ncbi:S-adenosyl-L-methionine-dependent methyltransferase [Zopfia rhizophila CBS 207.26]|uniref:S-adenosyl-L-methionine-dependent methyltransferase n=1 Tax=Zopfia rhizophila CBS 207.26 TaxID=1314779 RepID=A0A6A6DIB9_9PEZI|nr:S-adenosyl-L-methionine-dependent methyltransferase [Zopfia rhizophila CBS 207.26]
MAAAANQIWKDPEVVKGWKNGERVSLPAGELLLKQAGLLSSPETPLVILDNACGTGVISALLYDKLDPAARDGMQLTCGDVSGPMVEYVKQEIVSRNWKGANAEVVDAQKTGLQSDHFTHVITNMGWQNIPNSIEAIRETYRMLKPGGIFGATSWERIGWYDDAYEAVEKIPGAPSFLDRDTFMRIRTNGEWDRPEFVRETLKKEGFVDIVVEVHSTPIRMDSAEETMAVSFPKMLPAFTVKAWSKEENEKYAPLMKPALGEYLLNKYGSGKPFSYDMVAIIATARKPAV